MCSATNSLILAMSLLSAGAVAAEPEPISVSGFGTLGLVYNHSDGADFLRDLSQNRGAGHTRRLDPGVDSLLGLQVNAAFGGALEGVAQVVSRRRYDGSFRPELGWLFAAFTPAAATQLRVGRLGFDVYQFADSRQVGYSYPMVRPPVEFFGGLSVSHIDGADLAWTRPSGAGSWRAKLFAGLAGEKIPVGSTGTYYDLGGSQLRGANLDLQWEGWSYRIGYAQIQFRHEIPGVAPLQAALRSPWLAQLGPGPGRFADEAAMSGKRLKIWSAGVARDAGPFQAQLVFNRAMSESLAYPQNEAAYATLAYRRAAWTVHATYAMVRSMNSQRTLGLPRGRDGQLDALIQATDDLRRSTLSDQHSTTLGLRYDLMRNVDVKLQLDRVRVGQSLLWTQRQAGWDGRATLLSAAVDFIF